MRLKSNPRKLVKYPKLVWVNLTRPIKYLSKGCIPGVNELCFWRKGIRTTQPKSNSLKVFNEIVLIPALQLCKFHEAAHGAF